MNYELKFNTQQQLDGTQISRWSCCDDNIKFSDHQFFVDGVWEWGFVMTLDRKTFVTHTFDVKDWGSMEKARDAAENFSTGWNNVVVVAGTLQDTYNVYPNNEGVLVK